MLSNDQTESDITDKQTGRESDNQIRNKKYQTISNKQVWDDRYKKKMKSRKKKFQLTF